MPPRFAADMAVARGRIDERYAETFTFSPMHEVKNGEPSADTTRDTLSGVVAIFSGPGELQNFAGGGEMPVASNMPRLYLTASLVPQGVRRFDRFRRDDDGISYEVSQALPDESGGLVVTLVAL